jgi:phospholipid transport system substrate-binding protein
MNRLVQRVATILPAALLLLAPAPARAGVPTEQLKGSIDQIIKILEDPTTRAEAETGKRRTAIRQVAENIFDFQEAARRSLGRHWQSLSEQDRQEFTRLFSDLLEHSYVSRIEQYSGERIAYHGDSAQGDTATVKTTFTTRKGTDVPVDYRMLKRGDRWLVYDVSVEGLSLIANYRGQFNKIIETSSFQELVNRMKAKGEGFQAPGAAGGKKQS